MSKETKLNRRESAAIINSLSSGVVPRIGLRHMTVGRKKEVDAFINDLRTVEDGGAAFRFICGRYGSGKSFLLQTIRNNALDRDFVVMDADLSPERRLYGAQGKGLATYRELMQNISTRTRPEGRSLETILQRWINAIQVETAKEDDLRYDSPELLDKVSQKIAELTQELTEMSYGYSFSKVINAYWVGMRGANEELKQNALRWLRGEYSRKREARNDLGVDDIINDANWYDFLKLFARFVVLAGFKGLLIFIDEGVNLFKINHKVARENNYEKLLAVFNDTMQGKAEHIGFFMSETPESLYDERRGLFSYEALRSRLARNEFKREGFEDYIGPVINLNTLTNEEIFLLLEYLIRIYNFHYEVDLNLSSEELTLFLQSINSRLGAKELLTPREIIKTFLSLLNILQQNPGTSFEEIIEDDSFEVESVRLGEQDFDYGDEFVDFDL